jgi:light-regulated signal transduction histidine kinase (bacteriophytochrome)
MYEARAIWPDKSLHWLRVFGKVLYTEDKNPSRILGIVQDITDEKLFIEALEKKVAERTEALRQANVILKNSNTELEEFAFITSHDLQEPLRKIQMFNNIVLDKYILEEDVRKYIQKTADAANRMSGLIRDLLNYSRLTKGFYKYQDVDLNEVLKNIQLDFELLIEQKKAVVHTDRLPVVEAVSLQMNQLFFNLFGNALKFSSKKIAPVITITANKLTDEIKKSLLNLQAERDYCEIIFRDNGIGFDQEYADKIFTIFQRLNEQSLFGGYGIGLALCRKIVENNNGIIYAEGKQMEGASFTIILPYKQEDNNDKK